MGAWRQDGLADSYVGRNVTLALTCLQQLYISSDQLQL
jgi:hypothetical protein